MNSSFYSLAMGLTVLGTTYGCSSSAITEVEFELHPLSSHRYVVNVANQSTFDSLYLDLGDGRNITLQGQDTVYYPFQGSFDLTLSGVCQDTCYKASLTIAVAHDDEAFTQGFELAWSDEFDGAVVNGADWTFETGDHGWGNHELQMYTAGDNAKVEDGLLYITARQAKGKPAQQVGSYTSTRMVTKGKQEFRYGRIEARAKMPKGRGTWAAFWTLGSDIEQKGWPACGEIDAMEYVGYEPNVHHMATHTPSSHGNTINKDKTTIEASETEFHTYGVIWDKYRIQFYVDDPSQVYYTYEPKEYNDATWPYDKPHFLLLNLAIGGGWGGLHGVDDSIFPVDYVIDYVRVYQHPAY